MNALLKAIKMNAVVSYLSLSCVVSFVSCDFYLIPLRCIQGEEKIVPSLTGQVPPKMALNW